MRWNLLQTFDKIYILDLHGNTKKKESASDGSKDENIFNIQQGVSINIFVKTEAEKQDKCAKVYHYDLYGSRKAKYTYLLENTLASVKWVEISPDAPQYFFVKKDFFNQAEYEKGFSVRELFPVNGVGVTTAHDEFVIDIHKNVLLKRFNTFRDAPAIADYLHSEFNAKKKEGWNILVGHKNIQKNDVGKYIMPIDYRPFDKRYIFYEDKIVWRSVRKIMCHLAAGSNIALLFCGYLSSSVFTHVFITKNIADNCYISNQTKERGYIFPLYLYPDTGNLDSAATRRPNLQQKIVGELAAKIDLRFTEEKENIPGTFAPIDILDYIYAVLYSNNYRAKYKEFLKIDFPRVPYPENKEIFRELSQYGAALRSLHLLENVEPLMDIATYPVEGDNAIDKLGFINGRVSINKTQYFDNVPLAVWEYYIGGYQPAQKWLKDRKERTLDYDDILHYQKIITVLKLTIEIQQHIDKIIHKRPN
jgi:predicted helicase